MSVDIEHVLKKNILGQIDSQIQTANYSNEQCGLGIAHIGIGAFHRGHQAVYTQEMLNKSPGDWRITAVSLRSPQVRDQLSTQDYLYSVIERSDLQESVSVISSIDEVLVAPENPQKVIDLLANTTTKVITITVTEKGYCRNKSGQSLNLHDETVQHDLVNIQQPKSLPGFIVAACMKRMKNNDGSGALTIISCDNLPENGKITRQVVLDFSKALELQSIKNSELTQWIDNNVHFCNSMVDRIVPAITEDEITKISKKYGFIDRSVIVTEPFKQWVIEDNFAGEKPPWNLAGAMFVDDVSQFEHMKLRLLNGAHSTLAYIGFLLGYEFIHEAIEEPELNEFVTQVQMQLMGSLNSISDVDFSQYASLIRERFSNRCVPYKTSQVACDGSQKLPQRLIKPLEILMKKGLPYHYIAFVIAAWFRYLEGVDENNKVYTISDPMSNSLHTCAVEYKGNIAKQVEQLINVSNIFGETLVQNERFIFELVQQLEAINQYGLKAALIKLLNQT